MRLNYIVLILLLVLMPSTQCQQTAEDWFNKGSSLFDQDESDKAIEAYNEAIKLNPQYAEAWYEKGGILFLSREIR
jgi:tetratricopeptide (TPR) repeat protein